MQLNGIGRRKVIIPRQIRRIYDDDIIMIIYQRVSYANHLLASTEWRQREENDYHHHRRRLNKQQWPRKKRTASALSGPRAYL